MTKFILFLFTIFSILTYSQECGELESYAIKRINELRKNPKSFIPVVEKEIKQIDYLNSLNNKEGSSFTMEIKTFETTSTDNLTEVGEYSGESSINLQKKECEDLIKLLDTLSPMDTLVFDPVLYKKLTSIHASYLFKNKEKLKYKNQHFGPNGQSYLDRVYSVFGSGVKISENITYSGTYSNNHDILKKDYERVVDNVLLGLLLDSGLKIKGHRENLLNPKNTKVAVAVKGNVHVQNFR